eukprot:2893257-Pyramimonas_sp.AAC.1
MSVLLLHSLLPISKSKKRSLRRCERVANRQAEIDFVLEPKLVLIPRRMLVAEATSAGAPRASSCDSHNCGSVLTERESEHQKLVSQGATSAAASSSQLHAPVSIPPGGCEQ